VSSVIQREVFAENLVLQELAVSVVTLAVSVVTLAVSVVTLAVPVVTSEQN
jgi:hypothetical protein